MKKDIALLLVEASKQSSCYEEDTLTFRKGYSGRGMYGNSVAAVVGPEHSYQAAIRECVGEMIQDFDDDHGAKDLYDLSEEVTTFLETTMGAVTDNMGRDHLIWY